MRYNYSRFGCSGISYDGASISDVFTVVDVSVPILPTVEAVTQELAQRPGSYFSSRKIRTRQIKLKLSLDAESRCPLDIFQSWRETSSIFNKTEPKRLYLNEGKYIYAMFVGESDIEAEGYKGVSELTFECFDPFFYGEDHEIPLSGATKLSIAGGEAAFPVIEVEGAEPPLTVANAATGDFVRVPGIGIHSKVTVDMGAQVVTANGSYAPVELASDFFSLPPGEAEVSLSSGTGTLRYTERFL